MSREERENVMRTSRLCFSMGGLQTSSISIPWEFVRTAESLPKPQSAFLMGLIPWFPDGDPGARASVLPAKD